MKKKSIYNKIFKTVFILCMMIAFAMQYDMNVEAENLELKSFGVDITTENEENTYTIKWWRQELATGNEFYIILPHDVKGKAVKVNYESDENVYIDDMIIENGQLLQELTYGYHKISCGESEYGLFVIYGSDIPTVHITTDSGTMENVYHDIDYKESGYITILQNNNLIYEGSLEYIKGRGNYTWTRAKKPFNIKLFEKGDILGFGEAKKWCLLANYLDETLLKNKFGYDLADNIGLQYTPDSMIVDLYINDEYIGNYTLSERIEVNDHRIDITNLEDLNELANPDIDIKTVQLKEMKNMKWAELPNVPEIVTGGYLLELDFLERYAGEISGFVSDYGQPVVIKSPEYAAKNQVEYIKKYYQEFEDALLSLDGYNKQGNHYSEYIDVESAAKMYVFQEYIKNMDAGLSSCYFYKDVRGKLVAAPVWDLDSAFGRVTERNGIRMNDSKGLWVENSLLYENRTDKYTIFALLCKHNDFKIEVQRQWNDYFFGNTDVLVTKFENLYRQNQESLFTDKFKWNTVRGLSYSDAYDEMEQSIEVTKAFIRERGYYLDKVFLTQDYAVVQNMDETEGFAIISKIWYNLKQLCN